METVLVLARAILVAVFAVAGAAKLADLEGSRSAVAGFGVPERLARVLGTLLPFAELTSAALLAFGGTARVGALAALALLAAFSVGIARSIARGEAPDCHCFGQIHSEPAGPRTLVRNLTLAAIAGFAAFAGTGPGPGIEDIGQLSGGAAAGIGGGLLLAVLAAGGASAFLGLMRRYGALLLRVEALEGALRARGIAIPEPAAAAGAAPAGLPVGSPAPAFSLTALDGATVSLDSLRAAGKPVLLVFTDPGCGPCRAMLPRVGEWRTEHADALTIASISRGDAEKMRAEAAEHGVEPMLAEGTERPVSVAYRAEATPAAVVVNPDGLVAAPLAAGEPGITALVERATGPGLPVIRAGGAAAAPAPPPPPPGAAPGEPLPEPAPLRDLDGEPAQLQEALGGEERVLLFWDPGCGFCRRMVPQLIELESAEPEVARSLVLLSRGDAEANRSQGLSAPILIEESFTLGPAVGARGTPSALRVDADGRIASGVAVGADAVLALARNGNGNS